MMFMLLAHSCACTLFFFFNDTATTEIYTLSLHDALPICLRSPRGQEEQQRPEDDEEEVAHQEQLRARVAPVQEVDRKSTRLNSSHANISYAVFCLKKKKHKINYKLNSI